MIVRRGAHVPKFGDFFYKTFTEMKLSNSVLFANFMTNVYMLSSPGILQTPRRQTKSKSSDIKLILLLCLHSIMLFVVVECDSRHVPF